MNFNLIDFAILILLILGAVNGFKKGLLGSVVGLVGSLVALLISIKFYKPLGNFLNEKFGLLSIIHGFLTKNIPLSLEVASAPVNQRGIEVLADKLSNMTLPEFIKIQIIEHINNLTTVTSNIGIDTIGEMLTFIIATTLLNGLAFIILWFLVDKIIIILAKILTTSLEDTLLGSINRLAGLIIGVSLNALVIMVIIGILNLFLEITNQAETSVLVAIAKTFHNSLLVPYFKQAYVMLLAKIISFI